MNEQINYEERRKRFMETFKGDQIQSEKIPDLAAELMRGEFGIIFDDWSYMPICWTTFWQKMMEFLHSQQAESFSVSTCGFAVEYMTQYSESDKARNIVPELYHEYIPIFRKNHHNQVPGSNFNQELASKYNDWRSVNLTEIIDKVERETFTEMISKFGAHLMISATVFPLVAAIYCAGVRIAIETKKPVNMYNWFTITARSDDKIILTPLASIKQGLKDDDKKFSSK